MDLMPDLSYLSLGKSYYTNESNVQSLDFGGSRDDSNKPQLRTEDMSLKTDHMSGRRSYRRKAKKDNRLTTKRPKVSKLVFICDVCSLGFKTQYSLIRHKNKHTDKYLCALDGCQFKGGCSSDLMRHRKGVHSMSESFRQLFTESNKRIKTKNSLRLQKMVHKNKSNECLIPQKIQISDKTQELNDFSFQPNDQILRNENQFETRRRGPLKVFKCEVKGCEKVCHTSRGLLFHSNTHSDKYLCAINDCQYRAGTESDLNRHKQKIHSNEKPYKCEVKGCEKVCYTPRGILYHKIQHSGKFLCGINGCTYRAGNKTDQIKHQKTVHSEDRLLLCSICNKKFYKRHDLKQHQMTVHQMSNENNDNNSQIITIFGQKSVDSI